MFHTNVEHNHDGNYAPSREVPIHVMKEIKKMFDEGRKSKFILAKLAETYSHIPTRIKLANILASMKKAKYGDNCMRLGELEIWVLESSKIPVEDDGPFVVDSKIQYDPEPMFQIFISTKSLLAATSNILHADVTYKCVWQGYPILMVGITDRDKHYHHFGIGVCSNETTRDFIFLFEALKHGTNMLSQTFQPKCSCGRCSTCN